MKTVYAVTGGGLHLGEAPIPATEPGQVRVRVVYGGICGSDLHYAAHGRNGIYTIEQPLVLGHEIVGIVDAVADDVSDRAVPGQRVAIHPATPTPAPGSRDGAGLRLAYGGSYLGSASTTPHTAGGFAEYLIVRPEQLRILPDGLPLRRAALAEPLAVALHAVALAGEDLVGARVLVAGAGPIGSLVVAVLSARGVTDITVTDLQAAPLETARAVGAARTVLIGTDQAPATDSVDVVIESSGSPRSLASALDWVRRGGTIVQLGLLPAGELSIPLAALVSKEITLQGSQRFDIELDEAVDLLADAARIGAVVSHVLPVDDAVQAFDIAADSAASAKVLLRFGDDPDEAGDGR
ncbi:zinc-binding dehydrogenase [Mycetocola reblochoni]|uniref:L-idonate 5-dehydrogenase n=2 Tax=Mycetocola reblochoni TaxID=331618 RepID=A0A1R4IIF8_9MICO|nr:zinc-binding dehydrogenase [Mycetocola reblochoni]RLP69688.1 L-idonate 5-dehydrogenase [Mycetocola reblochoni]SJN19133.1 L-idonate 5-dehydrogenase [Mycetocola reblochoni REB411]